MRGHANLENNNPAPGNGENNPQEEAEDWLAPPSGWERWEPTTGIGDSEDVETIVFTATVDASDKGSIAFRLFGDFEQYGVSNYEGRYMNDKEKQNDTSADLYFAKCKEQMEITDAEGNKVGTWSGGGPDSTAITASWTKKPKTIVKDEKEMIVIQVKIVCNDFAAYGELQATLEVPENEPVHSKTHKIPKDKNANKVADYWEEQWSRLEDGFTVAQLSMDRDPHGSMKDPHEAGEEENKPTYPHGVNCGDGFNVFEEYRGFVVWGGYTRLDPYVKDLFLHSELTPSDSGLPSPFDQQVLQSNDTGFAGSHLPPIMTHSIKSDEWMDADSRRVNFCDGGIDAVNPQKGVLIVRGNADGAYGLTRPVNREDGVPFNPNMVEKCEVNFAAIGAVFDEIEKIMRDAGWAGQYLTGHRAHFIDNTIGHEVGHAIGLTHHAPLADPPRRSESCIMVGDGGVLDINSLNDFQQIFGTDVANFHHHSSLEDHWERYWLHENDTGHPSY